MDQDEVTRELRRAQLRGDLRQIDEQTLDARLDRYMEIDHQGIIGNHYFAAASSECINLYRDGHFIAAVMASQAVNEGILNLLADRNGIQAADHSELMGKLQLGNVISAACATASERIWKSFRNDVHHMNPKVATIPFPQLAKSNLQALAIVEREVFAVDFSDGKLLPKQPQYWDVQKDGTVPVFLRLGI
ncbi:MAG: hypothetical protein ACYTE3_22815 [Planctomycetota bacterium]|jgi:hypothetical protein